MQHFFSSYFGWIEQRMLIVWNIPKAVKKVPYDIGTMHRMSYI